MKIKLLLNYGGWNTNERRILPGVYDSDDPALFGLADYLVENKHAVVVEDETPEITTTEDEPAAPPVELDVTNRPKVTSKSAKGQARKK